MKGLAVLLLNVAALGCLGDVVSVPPRVLVKGYALKQLGEGSGYMITRFPVPIRRADGDVTKGFVRRLGCSSDTILASVEAAEGMQSAWWVLRADTEIVVGPLSDSELEGRMAREPSLRRIPIRSATEVWQVAPRSGS